MTGKTHIAIGLLTSALISQMLNTPISPNTTTLCVLGALMTDCDIDGSTISRETKLIVPIGLISLSSFLGFNLFKNLKLGSLITIPMTLKIGLVLLAVAIILSRITGHRHFAHSIPGAITFSISIYLILQNNIFYFVFGYLSHILIDLLNYKDEYIFYPLPYGISLKICKEGSLIDHLIGIASFAVFAFILLKK